MALKKLISLIERSAYFTEHLSPLIKSGKCTFSGMIGSSPAAIIAALARSFDQLLIVSSSSEKAQALKSEIELFLGREIGFLPSADVTPGEGLQPSKDIVGERLAMIKKWRRGTSFVMVAPVKALMCKTSRLSSEKKDELEMQTGGKYALSSVIENLIELGYRRFDIVGERGEFALRGGILDIFPLNENNPIRIEWQGDEIESIRCFEAYSQRSVEKMERACILTAREKAEAPILDYLPRASLIIFDELLEIEKTAGKLANDQKLLHELKPEEKYLDFNDIIKLSSRFKTAEMSVFVKDEDPHFSRVQELVDNFHEIHAEDIVVSKHALRLREEMEAQVFEGSLRGGFIFEGKRLVTDRELFREEHLFRREKIKPSEGVNEALLADLKAGDFVVHENYGIGIYAGTETMRMEGIDLEYFVIQYAEGDKVYVPPTMLGFVEKYSGGGEARPRLSRLDTRTWEKTKGRVKQSLQDLTKELLQLYATRQKVQGTSFPADDVVQKELEETFPYEETPDQARAILDAKRDMEASRPMDRLVCGDVGYGKTEVAIRAAVKVASAGKQAALLVPTTILAEQHYNTFQNRLKNIPLTVEMLSRFREKKEQAEIVKKLGAGGIDIIIGTHRLLQKDIKFKDLGLLIIDEEHRFGVAQKEKLKKIKHGVDVLTLTATPIPRTLYFSLSGVRNMSIINTPPMDRSPIRTYVLPWNESVVRESILREIDRGGQVYYLYNYVESIEGIAAKMKRIVPGVKIGIAHGQMPGKELEKVMSDFLNRKFDVLVCTAIIESGLDITNVNTVLVDYADHLGLAQLYQIRGRVGRSSVKAYAYLFYHPEKGMTETAIDRLKAIQEFTALGSGYKLAMRDLEIRGAGNLLGAEQSGHIFEVGFDLYCELLEEAVKHVKGIHEVSPRELGLDIKIEAFIPGNYVSDERQRIALYRRMNMLRTKKEVDEMKLELEDRFGPLPTQAGRLFDVLCIKVKALQQGMVSIKESEGKIDIVWLDGKEKRYKLKEGNKLIQINSLLR